MSQHHIIFLRMKMRPNMQPKRNIAHFHITYSAYASHILLNNKFLNKKAKRVVNKAMNINSYYACISILSIGPSTSTAPL